MSGRAAPVVLAVAFVAAAIAALPAAADEALLRRAFGTFLQSAEEMRIEAIPDLYEGGYARITAVGRRLLLNEGLRVDEAMIRLVGVSLDPAALQAGTLKVLDFRDSALQVRVLLRSLQDYFNAGSAFNDIRLWAQDGYLLGSGTVLLRGQPTLLRMKGFFAVSGTTEVFFYFDTLHAGALPVPSVVIRDFERQLNPVMHQRLWPVTFKIRSVKLDAQSLTISSQGEGAGPGYGGGQQPAYAP